MKLHYVCAHKGSKNLRHSAMPHGCARPAADSDVQLVSASHTKLARMYPPIKTTPHHICHYSSDCCFWGSAAAGPESSVNAQHTHLAWENTFGGDVLDIATALAPTPSSGGYIFNGLYQISLGGPRRCLVGQNR